LNIFIIKKEQYEKTIHSLTIISAMALVHVTEKANLYFRAAM
jgi:hypothetical protein